MVREGKEYDLKEIPQWNNVLSSVKEGRGKQGCTLRYLQGEFYVRELQEE